MFVNHSISAAGYPAGKVVRSRIDKSPNYKDGKFVNYHEWKQPSFTEFFSTMWDFLFSGSDRKPNVPLPRRQVDLAGFKDSSADRLSVTWLGHSTLMINIDGRRILTDPVFEKSVSFFGPTRYNGPVPIDIDSVPTLDVVLISHNHYDHLNNYSIRKLEPKTELFVVPLGVGAQLMAWDVPESKIIELDWWQEFEAGNGLFIAATPTQHFSGRGLTDRDKTLWASFVVRSANHSIFFGGDSGYFDGFKTIGGKYGPFDITFLECGAYNERWHHIHMFPEETVQAHIDLKGRVLHPIHWGTFNLSLHSWYEPMERFKRAARKAGISVSTPVVGGSTIYSHQLAESEWWLEAVK